jgi:precorrin-6B methylase 2
MEPKFYNELWMHREMLRDQVRTRAYQEAIHKAVTPGDTVLDFGSGSGILAMLAVQAGARKVFAVERTAVTEVLRELVAANNMADQIEIIEEDMRSAQLPHRVNVITSEWMGGFGVDENLYHEVVRARDRWLEPGGKLVPATVTALMAPAFDESTNSTLNFFRSRPYGLDLSPIAMRTAHEVHNAMHHVTDAFLVAKPQELWRSNAYTDTLEEASGPWSAHLAFPVTQSATFSALTAWFSAELHEGTSLTNAPNAPRTHWGRTVMPLAQPLQVAPGMTIEVQFSCHSHGRNLCHNEWRVRTKETPWQHHAGRQGCIASPGFH